MQIKIAVTDANIFIDLHELELTHAFFLIGFEVHTTIAVLNELYAEQQQLLQTYVGAGKLMVHNLLEDDFLAIQAASYPKSLSPSDQSVLHIANKLNACVLSSDKALRNCAKNQAIEYHGMLWIFDRLVETMVLTKMSAAQKLQELLRINFTFSNNPQLVAEVQKRLVQWK